MLFRELSVEAIYFVKRAQTERKISADNQTKDCKNLHKQTEFFNYIFL